MRLGRRDIGLLELDGGARESAFGISALALYPLDRTELGHHYRRLVVGLEPGVDVRLLLFVADPNRVGRGLGVLERVGNSQGDVLAVVANDIVLERRATLVGDAFESRSKGRTENSSDVLAMKDRAHARHLLGRGGVELAQSAVSDRRFDRHRIQHAGKVEVRRVLG